jgi:hypothetical protein
LKGAVRYFDGLTNDARLVLDTLRSAGNHGAVLLNYCQFKSASRRAVKSATGARSSAGAAGLQSGEGEKHFGSPARTGVAAPEDGRTPFISLQNPAGSSQAEQCWQFIHHIVCRGLIRGRIKDGAS